MPKQVDSFIEVRGARTHCLKNIDLAIPQNQLVVICGRSGSGKSSLAIDTIFAEGQRQFLECQSIQSRKFLEQIPRADVDEIRNLPPTVCSKQQNSGGSPRSTVGTLTEVHDLLRVLYSRAATVHCYQCDRPIEQATEIDICDEVEQLPEATRMMILAPLVADGIDLERAIKIIRRERLLRISIDGVVFDIEDVPPLDPESQHEFAAVIDRVIVREGARERLLKALDTAAQLGEGNVIVRYVTPESMEADPSIKSEPGRWETLQYSTRFACPSCNISFHEVSPRLFSFNGPQGACPDCDGLGKQLRFDVERVIDRSKSLISGAVIPWRSLSATQLKATIKQLQPLLKELACDASQWLSAMPEATVAKLLESSTKELPGVFALLSRELAITEDDDRYEQLASLERELPCQELCWFAAQSSKRIQYALLARTWRRC